MQSSTNDWEKRELSRVLPEVPTSSECVFCHELLGQLHSAKNLSDRRAVLKTFSRRPRRKRRKRCFPPLSRPPSDVASPRSGQSSISRESISFKPVKHVRKSGENLRPSSSSSSTSSLSLYTSESSESSDDDLDGGRRPKDSLTSLRSWPYDQPPEIDGLPPDYQSKYSSLQDWLVKRKSLRNAMGWKGDFARWLQNKRRRTPIEQRVLALYQTIAGRSQTKDVVRCTSDIQTSECSHSATLSRSLSDATEAARVAHTVSVTADSQRDLSQGISKSTDHLTPREFSADNATSILDEYLKERRMRLLDLFRCVDVSRSGTCSRRDFCYVLKEAGVRLTQAEVERMANELSVDELRHADYIDYSRLANAMSRHSELTLFRRKKRPGDAGVNWQSRVTTSVSRGSWLATNDGVGEADQSAVEVLPEMKGSETEPCEGVDQFALEVYAETKGSETEPCEGVDQFALEGSETELCEGVDQFTLEVYADKKASEKEPRDEHQNQSFCRRMMKLFRASALLDVGKEPSSSPRRGDGDQATTRSTLDDADGLATRLAQLRLRDSIEYEATRDAVRRHHLPVQGRALRRGMLPAADRPRRLIDVRRLPTAHMLTIGYEGPAHGQKTQVRTLADRDDGDVEDDERRSAGCMSAASTDIWRLELRDKPDINVFLTPQSSDDRHWSPAYSISSSRISGSEEMSEKEDEEDEYEEDRESFVNGGGDNRSIPADVYSGRPPRLYGLRRISGNEEMSEKEDEEDGKLPLYSGNGDNRSIPAASCRPPRSSTASRLRRDVCRWQQ